MTEVNLDADLARRPFPSRTAVNQDGLTSSEDILAHYLKRVDPRIADSFSREQQDALIQVFGLRGMVKHSIELRRSIRFGRRRWYFVFLLGDESRTPHRLQAEGQKSLLSEVLAYLGSALFWLSPLVLAVLALGWAFGAL